MKIIVEVYCISTVVVVVVIYTRHIAYVFVVHPQAGGLEEPGLLASFMPPPADGSLPSFIDPP
jgi:hypothetical protein